MTYAHSCWATLAFLVPGRWAYQKRQRDIASGRRQPDLMDKWLMGMDEAMSDLLWNGTKS